MSYPLHLATLETVCQELLASIKEAGTFKTERVIHSKQAPEIEVTDPKTGERKRVLNFCANNYLGLSSDPRICDAAKDTIDTHGFGMSSVRFICGT
jgi:glycine C-acetyltransferase